MHVVRHDGAGLDDEIVPGLLFVDHDGVAVIDAAVAVAIFLIERLDLVRDTTRQDGLDEERSEDPGCSHGSSLRDLSEQCACPHMRANHLRTDPIDRPGSSRCRQFARLDRWLGRGRRALRVRASAATRARC